MLRRRELLAYLVGAGTAGTVLAAPFGLRAVAGEILMPGRALPLVPIVLLPILWGVWNLVWARRHPRVSIAVWGALLGLLVAAGVNASLLARGMWFPAAALMLLFLPLVYGLLWRFVIGPLNEALGVEAECR